jgi:hypothetical protein
MIEDQLEIIGSAGSLKMSVFGSEPLELRKGAEKRVIPVEHPHHVQFPLLQTIVDELNGKGARCPSRGETALRTATLMDDVLNDYYCGREDAFWNRPETWPGRRGR